MKKNMGNTDRWIRIILAVIFAVLWFENIVTGTIGIILLVLGGIFVLTSIIDMCPLYSLFGITTGAKKKAI